jgi:starch phosphorylase
MKVLVNGGLNMSSLDGWWAEAFRPEVGWALPHGGGDDQDADAALELLEREVVPEFYERDTSGVPRRWVARVRSSMSRLTATYSANRAVREYTERFYLPALAAPIDDPYAVSERAARVVRFCERARLHWRSLRFGPTEVQTRDGAHHFSVPLYLADLNADELAVELYADADGVTPFSRTPMRADRPLVGARGMVYVGNVPDARPASHYTPRALPSHEGLRVPLELPLVLWAGG